MQGHRVEVVLPLRPDPEADGGVEQDVAGASARQGIERRGHGEGVGAFVAGGDPDVTEAGIPLLHSGGAQRLTAVGDDADVDIGTRRPGLNRPQDLGLPDRGRRRGIERLE